MDYVFLKNTLCKQSLFTCVEICHPYCLFTLLLVLKFLSHLYFFTLCLDYFSEILSSQSFFSLANSIHRDRYSKHLHRNYQTHTEISRLESGDCSSEPEKRTREASCTLFTRRLRCKGDSTNMIVESTSREPNDSGHKPDKESDQLTSNENSTPNALIPDSSNTVGDIHLLRDYSAQEIVHDSNEHVTNSVNPSDQSSNQFLSKNASFSSVENKIGELVIPEVLGLTPPISHDQDCVEDKTASPLTRSVFL